jgi:SAM-dependent methyltransferase
MTNPFDDPSSSTIGRREKSAMKAAAPINELVELKDLPQLRAWQEFTASGAPQMISAMHLCQAINAVAETGLLEKLHGGLRHGDAAALPGFDQDILQGLLRYLTIRGVLNDTSEGYLLTRWGELLTADATLARLGVYVGAYSAVTSRMSDLLAGKAKYGVDVLRDGGALGAHCATLFKIFHTDTIMTALEGRDVTRILDVGCGGGQLLVDACLRDSNLTGIGLDISADAVAVAKELAEKQGVADRVQFFVADAFDPATWPEACREVDALCIVSALHEHLRDGEQAVVDILSQYVKSLPKLKMLLVGEPELLIEDRENHDDFFLIHVLTGQGMPRDRHTRAPELSGSAMGCRGG